MGTYIQVGPLNIENTVEGACCKGVMVYTACISLMLFCFSFFQICGLGLANMASNEDIRNRWNGNPNNEEDVKIFSDQCSLIDKIKYMFLSELPESKLDK